MAKSCRGRRKVKQIPEYDIEEDVEVVGVEVLVRWRCSEEEIEKFENKQLEGCFTLSV